MGERHLSGWVPLAITGICPTLTPQVWGDSMGGERVWRDMLHLITEQNEPCPNMRCATAVSVKPFPVVRSY